MRYMKKIANREDEDPTRLLVFKPNTCKLRKVHEKKGRERPRTTWGPAVYRECIAEGLEFSNVSSQTELI